MNRAWLLISPEFLRDRLGLPADVEIVRADMNGANFEVKLGLQGESLPAVAPNAMCPTVMLCMHQIDDPITGMRKLDGFWSHSPETRWLIDERPIPPIPADFKWPVKEVGRSMNNDDLLFCIAKLDLAPGDVLVVKTDRPMTNDTTARLRAWLATSLSGQNKIMIIDSGIELSKLTQSEIAEHAA